MRLRARLRFPAAESETRVALAAALGDKSLLAPALRVLEESGARPALFLALVHAAELERSAGSPRAGDLHMSRAQKIGRACGIAATVSVASVP